MNQAEEILDFWFGLEPEKWWNEDPDLDKTIRERFCDLWKDLRKLPPESFLGSARDALAAVILFDQFPRNMFRDRADQFSTDPLAIAVAGAAVDKGYDEQLPKPQRAFLYMPLMHSEDLDDQRRSLLLFTALGDDYQLGFAKKHHDVIARFGRFPHRNAVLGRSPRPKEIAAGDVVPW